MYQGDSGVVGNGIRRDQDFVAASSEDMWKDPKVMVPGLVSIFALSLTLATVCSCLRRSKYLMSF